MLPGGRYQLATKWEVLFANTFTKIDSESFSSSVIGICEMSLWTSNIILPPWIFLSFLYTLYGQVSGKSSEVAMELPILVSWIATTCGWWQGIQEKKFMLVSVNINISYQSIGFQIRRGLGGVACQSHSERIPKKKVCWGGNKYRLENRDNIGRETDMVGVCW